MSVTEKESGIVDAHTTAIERTAAEMNTFIFIRPTEFDSTILIKAGYATKSMDVHHKSSNWGPMAGFVPCDPAFSKKCEGKPNPHEDEHPHGAAVPIQLSLKDSLVTKHTKIEFNIKDFELGRPSTPPKEGTPRWVVKRKAEGEASGMAAAKAKFENFQDPFPEHKFCTANPAEIGNKSTLFVLEKHEISWRVWWVEWQGSVGIPRPLRVFGYKQKNKVVPVTGDYDLWMVAPHFKNFDRAAAVRIAKDVHGSSAASSFTLNLNQRMNASCGRSENPVFNHGAESQNYGFTQALDWNLAMFTPAGTSRMVRMNQMPAILGDLQKAGYLVVWNKRYGEADPTLMGKTDERGKGTLVGIRETLEGLYGQLNGIREDAQRTPVTIPSSDNRQMPSLMKKEIAVMAQRFENSRNLGLEQSRIYRFHRELLSLLEAQTSMFRALSSSDFPAGFRMYEAELMRLHRDLQQALVAATTGSGQSAEQQLSDWLGSHKTEIEKLKTYWA